MPQKMKLSPESVAPGVAELAEELSALNNVELRSILLEERKGAPQYKALFEAAADTMEVEPIKQEEDVKDVKLEPALVDDEYVDIKPIVGVKQEPADGAAAAEAVAFKVVPECKEVAAGSTSVKELQVVIDGEYRYNGHFDLPHCTALAKLSSNCWSLNIHGNEALPSSLRSLQVGTVEDVDVLLLMTPSLQYLSMRQCSTETAELHKLTALTTLQELHLEYGMEPGYHTDENAYSWGSADDDSFVNVSAAAAWGELPMLNSLQLRSQERSGNDGPIKAAAVRHLGAAVGVTSLVVDSCWFEFESGAADLAAALSQLTKLQRLRLAGLQQVQSAAAGAAAVAAAAAAAAGSQMANGAAACCSSGSSNCGSGSSDYNSDSDSDSVSNALLAASRDDWQADSLPPASLASVLAAVAQLPQLTHLELEKLPLHKRQTVRRLAAAAALTHLSIERCDLRDDGARALAPCIARLRALRLDNNPNLGTAAVEAIMQMQPPLLCDLSLCGTGLNTEALLRAVMGQGLRREAQQSLISNLGLSEGQVQELLEGVGKLQRLQQEALSLLRNRNGVELDVDVALLLQAIIETSDL